jgi:hypothetical protein
VYDVYPDVCDILSVTILFAIAAFLLIFYFIFIFIFAAVVDIPIGFTPRCVS